jgi:WD40 repeat protein
MHHSLPHIYISALPFAPSNSKVAQRFRRHFPRTVHVDGNTFLEWPRVVFTVEEHDGAVNCAAFSPDGKLIVSGSSDKTVIVCDAENGDIRTGPMEEHVGYIGAVAFSGDGKLLASGSDDCTVKIWDTESGDLIAELRDPSAEHECAVTSVVFLSTDEGLPWRLASSYFDSCIRIWDVSETPGSESFGQLLQVLEGHKGGVTTIAYSPDGTKIASGSVDRSIHVWDASTGEPLNDEPFEGHMSCVTSVAFSPDGLRLASASEDETIQIWNLESGSISVGPLEGHTEAVTSIAWSPDGKRLVSGSLDGILILWDSESGNVVCEPFTGHKSGVTSVAFSPRGHRILSSSMDRSLRVWDAELSFDHIESESEPEPYTLTPFLDIPAHQDNLKCVAFSPNGLRIVSGSDDETIRLWDAETGEPIHDVRFHREDLDGHHWHRFPKPPSHSKGVDVVAYSPDGVLIASGGAGGGDGDVCIWDSESGELLQPVLRGHSGGITSIHFLPSDNRLVSGSQDNTIRVWDTHTGETVVGPLTPHTAWITSIAVSPDGTMIASASNNGTICVLDTLTGEEIGERLTSANDNSINCIAFDTHDSNRLLATSTRIEYEEDDNEVRTHSLTLWDLENGDEIWKIEEAHHDVILCLAVSPKGHYAASGSADETINIWNLSTGELVLGPLEGHTGTIFSIAFNHDGTRLVSGSGDEAIRVWDVSSVDDIRGCFVGARPAEFSDNAGYRNGWIVKSRRELEEKECLLLWVPPWCRSGIWWPRNTVVISEVSMKLDLRTFVHGERWFECYDPHVDS